MADVEAASYDEPVKQRLRSAADRLTDDFLWAKDVRDSYAHPEERVLGKAWNKDIENQPVDIPGVIKVAGGTKGNVFEISQPDGFVITLGDGSHAEVAVTDDSARLLRDRVQAVIDALPWDRPEHLTSRVRPSD